MPFMTMSSAAAPALRAGPLRVFASGARPEWLLGAVEAHHRALRDGAAVLKDEPKASIARVVHEGRTAVVKHYRYRGPRFLFKSLFRTHPGRRSLRAAAAMAARSVPAPEALGLVERRILGLPAESWLVTSDDPEAVEMDRFILRRFPAGCDPRRRRRFVLAFADVLRRLMASGIRHRDLKTCNILVREEKDSWRFAFIDLDDVEVLAPGAPALREDWVMALSHLNPSTPKIVPRTDRLRFLNRFPELVPYNRRELIAEVQEISRRRRRVYFSDEGPVSMEFE